MDAYIFPQTGAVISKYAETALPCTTWKHRLRGFDSGYTIAELVITVAMLAFLGLVLATSGVFDISGWLAHNRINAAAGELAANFQYAKMEAISRNKYCSVTFHQPLGVQIFDYVIYEDPNENLKYDAGDTLLKKVTISGHKGISFDPSEGGGDGLTFTSNSDDLPAVAFDPLGLPRNKTHGFGAGTAYLVDDRGHKTSVVVSSVGRIRTE